MRDEEEEASDNLLPEEKPISNAGVFGTWFGVILALVIVFAMFVGTSLLIQRNFFISSCSLAIVNTKVWTGDPSKPWAEAISIDNGRILAVGKSQEIAKCVLNSNGKARLIDGTRESIGLVLPGFYDSHTHLINGGFSLTSVQLRDAKTVEEFIQRIEDFVKTKPKGSWILEGNWNHENWGSILPTREWIDNVTLDSYVFVCRLDGHMCLANTNALEFANITKNTQDIPGGLIVRDSEGNPTGILKDNAVNLLQPFIPQPSLQDMVDALETASNYLISNGVTSATHMGLWEHIPAFEEAKKQGKLKNRVYEAVPLTEWAKLADKIQREGRGDDFLKFGLLKAFSDGSLGSHTALMFEPYIDGSQNDTGLLVTSEQDLLERTLKADAAGLQVCIHAIGDRANDLVLRVFEQTIKKNPSRDRRFRVEHAQTIRSQDVSRYSKNQIIASMQPYHLIDDGVWAEKILTKNQTENSYVFRSLLNSNVKIAFGSDWFVAPPIPVQGLYSAVTRSTVDGKYPNGWGPTQKMKLEEAIQAYTVNAAFAEGEENRKGKLKAGYLADLVLLHQDITQLADMHDLWNVKIAKTIVNGNIVYEK